MSAVLTNVIITRETIARARFSLPTYIHPMLHPGDRVSHFLWIERDGPVTLTIFHYRQMAVVYRGNERAVDGYWDDATCLLVPNTRTCYRLLDGELVAVDEADIDEHIKVQPASFPQPDGPFCPNPFHSVRRSRLAQHRS